MHPILLRAFRRAAPILRISLAICAPLASASGASPVPAPSAPGAAIADAPDYSAFYAAEEEAMPDSLKHPPIAPTNTLNGTRGLSQTPSAEALGAGRLVLGLSGPWYRQERAFAGAPNRDADIFTGVATLAYGLAPALDIFASLTGYSSLNYNSSEATGLGTLGAGAQVSWPELQGFPLAMAAQAGVFGGLSDNPINRNGADGYNYFETRTGTDFRGLLIQSLVFGPERLGFKAHFNEGLAWSTRDDGPLMLLAAGLQANLGPAAAGLELHSRTRARDAAFRSDPLWLTPSLQVRTGWNVNLTAGADIALSRDRDHSVAERSMEPWRLMGGIAFTVDTRWKGERDAQWAALKARRAQERAAAVERERKASELAEAAAAERKARADLAACLAADRSAREPAKVAEKPQPSDAKGPKGAASARRAAQDFARRTPFEKRLLSGETVRLGSVPFASGKTELPPSAKPYLDDLARILMRYPNLRYELGGHADGSGNPEVNRILSQARAVAVKSYLAEKEPALEDRVGVMGYGDAEPISDNTSHAGRKANRKPDLKVANKAALAEYNPRYEAPQAPVPTGTAMGPEEQ